MTGPSPYDAPPRYEVAPGQTASRRTFGCLLEIAETLILTVFIFFVIQTFIAQPYQVRQQSMERTLEPNEYVLVDKLTPRFDTYKRGDVIVFEPPEGWATGGDRTPFIKRIIGVGGDVVELHDGKVVVNGRQLQEPYLFTEDGIAQPTDPTAGQSRWTVPQGELFVMGDHREASADSRTFGPVPVSSVIGRAWLRYWPVSKLGLLSTPRYDGLSSTPAPGASPVGSPLAVSDRPRTLGAGPREALAA